MSRLTDEQRAMLTGPEARMQGYYIGFEKTGNPLVDQILSAVAYAAKGSHSTEGWGYASEYGYGPVPPGESFEWLIQQAANDAAERLAEQSEVEWEYGFRLNQTGTADRIIPDSPKGLYPPERGTGLRRRKPGPWVPVNENGSER